MKLNAIAGITVAVVFAAAGLTVSCVDLRDYVTVDPTLSPSPELLKPSEEPLTINDAKREVTVVVDATNRWAEWRLVDIAKAERPIAFAEGLFSSGLQALSESAGVWAGPFLPIATLLLGYATKRRHDATPEQLRQEKEDSYNAGIEVGKAAAAALLKKESSGSEES